MARRIVVAGGGIGASEPGTWPTRPGDVVLLDRLGSGTI
jgi:hypothetical protein